MATSSVLCARDGGFSAGLIEAMTQCAVDDTPVLLVVYDTEYPEPLYSKRPVPDSMGIALVLSPKRSERSIARIAFDPLAFLTEAAPDTLDDPQLEALRQAIPAATGLPLLQAIAKAQARSARPGLPAADAVRAGRRAMLNGPRSLDRDAIMRRIPHQGTMCLLDAVLAWDDDHIRCSASSHLQPDHPLRAHGRLGAACGVEYAAQAMAVHGALVGAGARGRGGQCAARGLPRRRARRDAARRSPRHRRRRAVGRGAAHHRRRQHGALQLQRAGAAASPC